MALATLLSLSLAYAALQMFEALLAETELFSRYFLALYRRETRSPIQFLDTVTLRSGDPILDRLAHARHR